MRQSHALSGFGVLIGAAGYVNAPTPAYAGEKNLELSSPSGDRVESLGLPSISRVRYCRFFRGWQGRGKRFHRRRHLLKGLGPLKGYSAYTFENGSSITSSYCAEAKAIGLHGE